MFSSFHFYQWLLQETFSMTFSGEFTMGRFLFSRNAAVRPKQGLEHDFFLEFYSAHVERKLWVSTVDRLNKVKVLPNDTFITSGNCIDLRVFFLNMLSHISKRDRYFLTHGKEMLSQQNFIFPFFSNKDEQIISF